MMLQNKSLYSVCDDRNIKIDEEAKPLASQGWTLNAESAIAEATQSTSLLTASIQPCFSLCVLTVSLLAERRKHNAFHLQRTTSLGIRLHIHSTQTDIVRGNLVFVRSLEDHPLQCLLLLHSEN